jgi:hypothetical protein
VKGGGAEGAETETVPATGWWKAGGILSPILCAGCSGVLSSAVVAADAAV